MLLTISILQHLQGSGSSKMVAVTSPDVIQAAMNDERDDTGTGVPANSSLTIKSRPMATLELDHKTLTMERTIVDGQGQTDNSDDDQRIQGQISDADSAARLIVYE